MTNVPTASLPKNVKDRLKSDPMLHFMLSTIDTRIRGLEPRLRNDQAKIAELNTLREAVASFYNADGPVDRAQTVHEIWTHVYCLERRLGLLEPDETILLEVARQVEESQLEPLKSAFERAKADYVFIPTANESSQTSPTLKLGGAAALHSLLQRVLETTHYTLLRNFLAEERMRKATTVTLLFALAALLLLIAPYFYLYQHEVYNKDVKWPWFPLYTVLSAGWFGAFFSRLQYLQKNSDQLSLKELRNARDPWQILLRGIVGMAGALVLFFVLQSGLFTGRLFPSFDQLGFNRTTWAGNKVADASTGAPSGNKGGQPIELAGQPSKDLPQELRPVEPSGVKWLIVLPNEALALLLVWSFLAGFSERLVPSILSSTEKKLDDAGSK